MACVIGQTPPVGDRRFELDQEAVTLGRHRENGIMLDDPSVSGRHAVLLREGTRYRVRDLDSTTGTLVNGESVRDRLLEPGDRVAFGDVVRRVEDEADLAGEPDIPVADRLAQTVSIRTAPVRPPASFRSASPFGGKREGGRLWAALVILAAAAAVAGMAILIVLAGRA